MPHGAAGSADCSVVLGPSVAPQYFPLHRALLAARCPLLLAMILLQDRFVPAAALAADTARAAAAMPIDATLRLPPLPPLPPLRLRGVRLTVVRRNPDPDHCPCPCPCP